MDTSELYIMMCDCEWIQSHRKPKTEKMNDGRWHYEWELESGDFFATRDLYEKEEMQIEVKGTTIYDPYFYDLRKDANIDISTVGFDEGDGYITKSFIWLPRQDQIQEMLGSFVWTNVLMEKCFNGEYPSEWPMDSWEKRWLHLYMQVRHKKIWDRDKWKKRQL